MIKFTDKIKQDFLPIEWVKKLQDAGIEMIDSKYMVSDFSPHTYAEKVEFLIKNMKVILHLCKKMI